MKKLLIVFAVLFLIVISFLLTRTVSSPNILPSPTPTKNITLATKENNEGSISIAVTPQSLETGSPTWNFKVELNTHSVELNADLVVSSELIDNEEKSYKPISWEGAPPGGHHREGILKFNPISPKPKSLELKIKNVGGAPERRFKWNL